MGELRLRPESLNMMLMLTEYHPLRHIIILIILIIIIIFFFFLIFLSKDDNQTMTIDCPFTLEPTTNNQPTSINLKQKQTATNYCMPASAWDMHRAVCMPVAASRSRPSRHEHEHDDSDMRNHTHTKKKGKKKGKRKKERRKGSSKKGSPS